MRVMSKTAFDTLKLARRLLARSRVAGRAQRLHELSRFVRADGRWYYLDGDLL